MALYVFAALIFFALTYHFGPYRVCLLSSDGVFPRADGGIFSGCPTSDLESNLWDVTPFALTALTVMAGELLAYRTRSRGTNRPDCAQPFGRR